MIFWTIQKANCTASIKNINFNLHKIWTQSFWIFRKSFWFQRGISREVKAAMLDGHFNGQVHSCYLGPFQTLNFTRTELNTNKLKQKNIHIYIEFGACEVQRLNYGL